MTDRTAALVLAAELSPPGFPEGRYLAELNGRPLLQAVLDDVARWPVDRTVLVLGSDADRILDAIDPGSATVVVDEGWEEGSASPLRAGLDVLLRDGDVDAAIVAPGDLPGIPPEVVGLMLEQWRLVPSRAVVPEYRYAPGWPVLLPEDLFPRLLGLEGDVDLHGYLAGHGLLESVHVDRLAPRRITVPTDLPGRRR